MKPQNLLFIISDEHARSTLGCYGNEVVKTPHLDRLAATGTRFTNAYTPSPICVPARASLATGQWVHQLHTWSSAEPYEGQVRSWAHRLRETGHRVASIGKLHFRDSHKRNGFSEEILPMHIANGVGWVKGLMRKHPIDYDRELREFAEQIGPGESSYTVYDRNIAKAACQWLKTWAEQPEDKPWVLFLSFVCPHYPLYAPPKFFELYNPYDIEMPFASDPDDWPQHPALKEFYEFYNYHPHFDENRVQLALRSYYALCSFLDHNIGQVLATLSDSGMADETRIIYTSDHGDILGNHGQWTKMLMYEDSVAIPFIMSGADISSGAVVDTPISLIDCYQTIVESVGESLTDEELTLPGRSLFKIANGAFKERVTFSEYHDGGPPNGYFMLRMGDWKYIYYVGHPPQLFNLVDDPRELKDLGQHPAFVAIQAQCEAELRKIVDPEAVNTQAHADQATKLAELGGVDTLLNAPDAEFGFTPIANLDIDIKDLLNLGR